VNVVVDFSIRLSGGFIRNKLGINTSDVKNWILSDISFSILNLIMFLDDNDNYKVKDQFKTVYGLNKNDIEILEASFAKVSNLYPNNEAGLNVLWQYLNNYSNASSLAEKSALFNFNFNSLIVTEINTKDVSLVLDNKNKPMYIQTQEKFDSATEKVYLTRSGPLIPVSTEIGYPRQSVVRRTEYVPPAKDINTKINEHIYMVNKK
jgi:hypothetical protein